MPAAGHYVAKLSIFVEGSFDYAHFLPSNERCFPLHGHTAAVELELTGQAGKGGMLMDFSEVKILLNKALAAVDHKLVASESYSKRDGDFIAVAYGDFSFRLPADHVFILDGEGTSENIARRLAELIMEGVPPNVSSIRLTINEGLRKGASVTLDRA